MSEELIFLHKFGAGVQATMRMKDEPPGDGVHLPTIEWTGRPKKKHLTDYRRWVLTVQQILANRWQQRIGYMLQTGPSETELWQFEPGAAPKLVERLKLGIF
jgi:hypothetical protein